MLANSKLYLNVSEKFVCVKPLAPLKMLSIISSCNECISDLKMEVDVNLRNI